MVWIKIRKIQTVMICQGKDRPKMVPLPCRTAGERDHHGVSLPQDKAYEPISWTGLESLHDELHIFPNKRDTEHAKQMTTRRSPNKLRLIRIELMTVSA